MTTKERIAKALAVATDTKVFEMDSNILHLAPEIFKAQFGDAILQVVHEVLSEHQVDKATVRIVDRGALECVIRARVETAILRGKGDA